MTEISPVVYGGWRPESLADPNYIQGGYNPTVYAGDGALVEDEAPLVVGSVWTTGPGYASTLDGQYVSARLVYNPGMNKNRGIMEFDLGDLQADSVQKVVLNLSDSGGKGVASPDDNGPPAQNEIRLLAYPADLDSTPEDYNRSANVVTTFKTRAEQGPGVDTPVYFIDLTDTVKSYLQNGQTKLGLRFEAATADTFEAYGGASGPRGCFLEVTANDPIDLVATALNWNQDRTSDPTRRGIDFSYEVSGGDLPGNATVAFYWARGQTFDTRIGAALPLDPNTASSLIAPQGVHGPFNEPARWGAPPAAAYILLVLDPPDAAHPNGLVLETDETNNVFALPLHTTAQILNGAVKPMPNADGITMDASFVPGRNTPGGPLTLSEAEVVLGVDHFNWEQTVHGPSNWEFQAWRNATAWLPNGQPADGTLLASGHEAVDPIIRGDVTETYYIRVDGLFGVGDVRYFAVPQPVDSHPFYLNEEQVNGPPQWQILDGPGGTKSANEFVFSDDPKVPDWAYDGQPNHYLTFSTTLVGVGPNHEFLPLNGPGTTFTWKSNTVINVAGEIVGGGIRYRGQTYPDSSLVAPVIGGGLFDVRGEDGTSVPGVPDRPAAAAEEQPHPDGARCGPDWAPEAADHRCPAASEVEGEEPVAGPPPVRGQRRVDP